MPRVLVLGAGVAGLAAAVTLRDEAPELDVDVLEAADRAGGLIRTELCEDFVIERGPESILTDKPAAILMARRLGLEDAIVGTRPEQRGAFVVCEGRLERVPDGFSLVAPTDLGAFFRSPVVSMAGKVRATLDLVLPGSPKDDETLEDFVTRRFGREVLDKLAQPLVGGIYGAHPSVLGLAATMPRFLDAERRRGSVIRGLREAADARAASGARYALFVNFRRGMQTLTDAMAAHVADRLAFGVAVRSLRADGGRFVVETSRGVEHADSVVVALGGRASAALVRGVDSGAADLMETVRHGSGAIVTLAFRRDRIAHALDAYGYVTPFREERRVIASTFLSRKWPGRAPEGIELLRFFFGRDGDDGVVDLDDGTLTAMARAEAATMLGAHGDPLLVRVDRWRAAMPRFGLGHLTRMDSLDARIGAIAGLALAGNAYRGVGIPDAIASGARAARAIMPRR